MSYISWSGTTSATDPHDVHTVVVRGWERAHLAYLARGPALAAWDIHTTFDVKRVAWLGKLLKDQEDYLASDLERYASLRVVTGGREKHELGRRLVESLTTLLIIDSLKLRVGDVELDTGNVHMNTAVAVGGPVIQLAAKLHGYCEIHAWVDGPDREWLANIIEDGLDAALLRDTLPNEIAPSGWRDVIALLRTSALGPVVTAFSVTDEFPNPATADWTGEDSAWYDLPEAERWDRGLAGLRTEPWLQLSPRQLGVASFAEPVTVYDLLAPDRVERVKRKRELYEWWWQK